MGRSNPIRRASASRVRLPTQGFHVLKWLDDSKILLEVFPGFAYLQYLFRCGVSKEFLDPYQGFHLRRLDLHQPGDRGINGNEVVSKNQYPTMLRFSPVFRSTYRTFCSLRTEKNPEAVRRYSLSPRWRDQSSPRTARCSWRTREDERIAVSTSSLPTWKGPGGACGSAGGMSCGPGLRPLPPA